MNKNLIFRNSLLASLVLVLSVACSDAPSEQTSSTAMSTATDVTESQEQLAESLRWYTPEQVTLGNEIFAQNCAVCHGENAQGTVDDWKQRLDDGSFPPPPLNGSAHAWHHPTPMLMRVINNGGAAYGGNMPPFADVLEEEEKLAAIAFFQNFWSDEIYSQWEQMGGAN